MDHPIILLIIIDTLLFLCIATLLLQHIIRLLSINMSTQLVDQNYTVIRIVNSVILHNNIIFNNNIILHNSLILHNRITNHQLDVSLTKGLCNHTIILYKLPCPVVDLLIQILLNGVPLLSIHKIRLLIITKIAYNLYSYCVLFSKSITVIYFTLNS